MIYAGAQAMDFTLAIGWDSTYGGLFFAVDAELGEPGKPKDSLKKWFVHCEALRATLLAYHLTREERYFHWFVRIHDWAFEHFADPEFGEWFGQLNRDGTVADQTKGGFLKGAFHLPRALFWCWQLLEEFAGPGWLPAQIEGA